MGGEGGWGGNEEVGIFLAPEWQRLTVKSGGHMCVSLEIIHLKNPSRNSLVSAAWFGKGAMNRLGA